MDAADKAISRYLDDMALKILMVEPGDLSVVGEILEILEQMLASATVAALPTLQPMIRVFKEVLEKIIMAELADSAENFERLGEAVSVMQETTRLGNEAGPSLFTRFLAAVQATGFVAAATPAPAAPE
ncbi:MAG: chemotaxis protein CheA, partial [Thermodesulfobacteriota bacterium]